MPNKFLISFTVTVVLLGLFALFNFGMSTYLGETLGYAEIVKRQQEDHSVLYGPLFNNDHVAYKECLYQMRHSSIVVAGSSRALPFFQSYFKPSMANCGRIAYGLKSALVFMDKVAADQSTTTLFMIVDYWWFRTCEKTKHVNVVTRPDGTERTWGMFYEPFWLLVRKRLSLNRLCEGMSEGRIGLRAAVTGEGFLYDGGRSRKEEGRQSYKQMQKNIKARLGKGRFKYGTSFCKQNVDLFWSQIERLRSLGKHVVVILPPLSPAFYDELSTNPKNSYALQVVSYLKSLGAYDYTDPMILSATSSDFADFFHHRSKLSVRMLQSIAREDPIISHILSYTIDSRS